MDYFLEGIAPIRYLYINKNWEERTYSNHPYFNGSLWVYVLKKTSALNEVNDWALNSDKN